MKRDRLFLSHSLFKVVSLEYLPNGRLCRELDEIGGGEFIHPLAVEPQLGLFRIEQLEHLLLIGFGVGIYLLTRQRRTRYIFTRRVADHPCKIAYQEDDDMAKVLKRL